MDERISKLQNNMDERLAKLQHDVGEEKETDRQRLERIELGVRAHRETILVSLLHFMALCHYVHLCFMSELFDFCDL